MKKWGIILLLIIIAFLIIRFFLFKEIKQPEFTGVSQVKVNIESSESADIFLRLNLFNPNPLDARLLNTEIKAELNDQRIGSFSQTNVTDIKARDTFSIPLKIHVNPQNFILSQGLSGLVGLALSDKKVITPLFSGYVRIRIDNRIYNIPVEFEQTLTFQ